MGAGKSKSNKGVIYQTGVPGDKTQNWTVASEDEWKPETFICWEELISEWVQLGGLGANDEDKFKQNKKLHVYFVAKDELKTFFLIQEAFSILKRL